MKQSILPLLAAATMFSAFAQNASVNSRSSSFPPVGLGSTETAEISVVNLASDATTVKASCSGTISFVNASGATIGAATNFTVTSGQIFSVRLPFASSGGTAPRAHIRGVVSLNAATATPRPPCSAEFIMETFDTSTGATHTLQVSQLQPPGPFGFRD